MLRLSNHDILMQWLAGIPQHVPDGLSRLSHSEVPEADTDDPIPDDPSSGNPLEYTGPRGPTIDGIFRIDLMPAIVDEEGGSKEKTCASPAKATEASPAGTARSSVVVSHQSRKKHPFCSARTAAIDPDTPTRRSAR